ncbi:unnamed protein product, partial [Strongylus vulgaris]
IEVTKAVEGEEEGRVDLEDINRVRVRDLVGAEEADHREARVEAEEAARVRNLDAADPNPDQNRGVEGQSQAEVAGYAEFYYY